MSDAVNIEMNVQFFCDLAASKDGRYGRGELRSEGDHQVVKLFISNPDLEYADTFSWNRHG